MLEGKGGTEMKMKEVCTASGLTERAVRFYAQEGLAAPDAQRRGGRTWLDFSPADVERLKAIATLRRAGFTVEELRAMTKDFPQAAPEAAFALRRRLRERLDAYERVCQSDPALAESLEDYAAQLWGDVAREPLPAADRARSPLPWERWVEWGSMALAAWLGFRLYVPLYSPLGELLFSLGMNPVNTLLFLMLFLAVVLPICLALGSRFGKWLASHLDF